MEQLEVPFAATNETLTFSNLIENGDEYLDSKKCEHNLELVIPAPISNIRSHEGMSMRGCRPLCLDLPSPAPVVVRLE